MNNVALKPCQGSAVLLWLKGKEGYEARAKA